ncbi:hypothetical protein BH23BAC4_BH23BAC4_13850 [soil metagenome]
MSRDITVLRDRASRSLGDVEAALQDDGSNVEDVVLQLREALSIFCASYLHHNGYKLERNPGPGRWESDFFTYASQGAASKVVVLRRKLNYLQHAAPYDATERADGEWMPERVRSELAVCTEEIATLFQHLSRTEDPPSFRGEFATQLVPGQWVVQEEYDWGTWYTHLGVVLRVRLPWVFVRFPGRPVEGLDMRVAVVRPADTPAISMADPLHTRRAWFDMYLWRNRGLRPTSDLERAYGPKTAHYVYTCACCGFPTRRYAFPHMPVLGQASPPVHGRCTLCHWSDAQGQDDPAADRHLIGANAPYSLAEARANVRAGLSIYSATDQRQNARLHRRGDVIERKRSIAALFNAMVSIDDDDADETLLAWAGAQAQLERLVPLVHEPESAAPAEAPAADHSVEQPVVGNDLSRSIQGRLGRPSLARALQP